MPDASSSRSRASVGNRAVSLQSATPEMETGASSSAPSEPRRVGSVFAGDVGGPDGLGQVAGVIFAWAGVAAGDPVPGEVLRGQEPARRTLVLRHRPGRPPARVLLGAAEDHAADHRVQARPGDQHRLDRIDRQHGDPPAADPPLDRQHVRAGLAQRDGRRSLRRVEAPTRYTGLLLGGRIGAGDWSGRRAAAPGYSAVACPRPSVKHGVRAAGYDCDSGLQVRLVERHRLAGRLARQVGAQEALLVERHRPGPRRR